MSTLTYMMKDFRHRPPADIDPDHPDKKTEQALFSLVRLTSVLQRKSPSTVTVVTENWAQIWPWIYSLARCVLDKAPVTFIGSQFVYQFTTICPVLVTYPTYSIHCGDFRNDLTHLLMTSPHILAVTAEMWLYASRTSHEALRSLCDSVGLLLECNLANRALETPSKHLEVLLRRLNDDITVVCIKGIAFEVAQKPIACEKIRSSLVILGHLYNLFGMATCIDKNAVRWLAILVAKLSSPRKYYRGSDFEDLSLCLRQSLGILCQCVSEYPTALLGMLDMGIVSSIYRARNIIVEDSHRREINESWSLASVYATFLSHIARHLTHRSVLIRMVVSIRRLQRLGTTDETQLRDCGPVLRAWLDVRGEVARRHSISKWQSEVEDKGIPVCGFTNCPRTSEINIQQDFRRCFGCGSTVYCSRICQKRHWKSGHRGECKTMQASLRAGKFPFVSAFDVAFMQKQFHADYRYASMHIQVAVSKHKEKLKEVHEVGDPVVSLDYSEYPARLGVHTLRECRDKLKEPDWHQLSGFAEAGMTPLAFAIVPWSQGEIMAMILRPACLH
ncbi:mynd finger family protein [Moniliophthora roreri MCA 2997]|uniref:Mynd finger family protein n=2 Tax=Moniliophthora roreri TaxID=221103 RepID=V2XNV7_MONRO|nr:mynd finger family protein [Moniliophthora roreri MCA 2997]KAI3611508.1 mynd finger family protein [Moniliophthora roreri]